jgi:multisubunit Na+/H+ antiporter MnhF subunit
MLIYRTIVGVITFVLLAFLLLLGAAALGSLGGVEVLVIAVLSLVGAIAVARYVVRRRTV